MTDPAVAPETPDVAETVSFLRRFADLMANGYNGAYLRRAADLLETLTARVIASSDEDDLWRYKYETLTQHADALEAECEALKNDVEGHLDITSSVLAERDALLGTLQAREAELAVLREALSRERDERAAKSAAHEEALNELRTAFDQKREALQTTLEARMEECDRLRCDLDREREDGAAKSTARESELSELRLAFDRERGELQAELKARGDELATFRTVSEREHDALKEKIAALEAKRAEIRSAFDRINILGNQAIVPHVRRRWRRCRNARTRHGRRSPSGAAERSGGCRRGSQRRRAENHAAPGARPVRISRQGIHPARRYRVAGNVRARRLYHGHGADRRPAE